MGEIEYLKGRGSDFMKEDGNGSKKIVAEIWGWIKPIIIGVVLGLIVVKFVAQVNLINGESMFSTLKHHDVVFSQKISTYFNNYKRGDIVLLNGKGMEGYTKKEDLIKRIVGMPGETVKIEDGKVYIKLKGEDNFNLVDEDYLDEGTVTTVNFIGLEKGYDLIELGDDEYYCMGDNRQVSNDSRALGPFSKDRIDAVVVVRLFPFNHIKLL